MRPLLRAAVVLVGLALAPVAAAQEEAPPAGAWLRYQYTQRLTEPRGEYVGYQESTTARARYDVVRVRPGYASIHGRYVWSYTSSEGRRTGAEDREVEFLLPSRRYVQRRTDVADYDEQNGNLLATWIWIPPSSTAGGEIEILDQTFTIVAADATVDVHGAARPAIHARASYADRRDDDYGHLQTNIVDEYWFDPTTGLFLREHHVERASGTLEGRDAGFTLDTTIELVDASYAPAPSPPPEEPYTIPREPPRRSFQSVSPSSGRPNYGPIFMLFLCVGVGVALTIGAFVLVARRSRRRRTASGQIFQVRRQSRSAAPSLGPLSPTFDPFIPHLVHVAQATGQKIVCADGIGGSVLGVGIDDAPAQLATIFAKDSDVCEAIRKELGRTEFFSDTRHPRLASVAKTSNPGPAEAYNVYETYELLELTARPDDLGYDGDVVDPLKPADVAEAGALLDAVYGVPCKAWLEASIAAGDLAWVAREGGRIVGVAMASLVGDHARLHALTVSAAHRGRGLGTALYRARLRGLFDLGAARVLTECATWNLGALDLAREHGFVKIGMMYVESARSERQERKFLRR